MSPLNEKIPLLRCQRHMLSQPVKYSFITLYSCRKSHLTHKNYGILSSEVPLLTHSVGTYLGYVLHYPPFIHLSHSGFKNSCIEQYYYDAIVM